MVIAPNTAAEVIYSESDGQPMAENTKQFRWIVTIKENLEILFANQLDVFIAQLQERGINPEQLL